MSKQSLTPAKIETLVLQVQTGDVQKFSEIFDFFYEKIFRFVSFRVDNHEVEDIVSDVFLKVVEKIKKYKRTENIRQSFSSWVFRIAQNTVIDFYRKQKEVLGLTDEDGNEKFLLEDENDSPDESLQKSFQKEEITNILQTLTPIHAQVLELRYLEDFTYKEIANVLEKSEGNVRIIHMRALREIRKKFPRTKE